MLQLMDGAPGASVQHIAAGNVPVVLVSPHATAPLALAVPFVMQDHAVQEQLAAHVAEWHDAGSGEALQAAVMALQATGVQNALPRGLLDLNRGWRGRVEEQETLFGKGAVDKWVGEHLAPGALGPLEECYRAAIAAIRQASQGKCGMVEVHSYGELGSTYDRLNGGRPVRRPQVAIVDAAPWRTARPVGLARLIPGDLRAIPWPLFRRLGDALQDVGLHLGPHPYPAQAPWTLSARFLADRWFAWLADTGQLPRHSAQRLSDLAWQDEQHADIDSAIAGDERAGLPGVAALASRTLAWDADSSAMGERFLQQTQVFATTVELRCDLTDQAEAMGGALAAALRAHVEAMT